jgi:Heterokaryon incompatibility protein (HET)
MLSPHQLKVHDTATCSVCLLAWCRHSWRTVETFHTVEAIFSAHSNPAISAIYSVAYRTVLFIMNLLNTNVDGSFSLTWFAPDRVPPYAILSHRWGKGEVTFQDLKNSKGHSKKGYKKIVFCAEQAKKDGLQFYWIDSCCIDRMNFTELSTAINSMFRWYRKAAKCYVHLSDFSTSHPGYLHRSYESAFKRSKWFTRGWTLQELLAPTSVDFFSKQGVRFGNRRSLRHQIGEVTGIPIECLEEEHLSKISIATRLSWIANRETTIEEDIVYSLLGVFGVHMPLIYGEGVINALYRLGEAIEKHGAREHRKPTILIRPSSS